MGQTISNVVKSLSGNEEKEKEVMDALNALMTLARAKRDLFFSKIESSVAQPLNIPIERIISSRERIFCTASNDAGGVKDAVKSIVGGFTSGNFVDAISNSLTVLVDSLLGNYQGNESEMTNYTIIADPLGGVARVDYYMYAYQFASKGLVDAVKNVLIVCVVISSAEVKNLTKNTVMTVVANKYNTDDDEQKAQAWKLIDTIMANVEAANGRRPSAYLTQPGASAVEMGAANRTPLPRIRALSIEDDGGAHDRENGDNGMGLRQPRALMSQTPAAHFTSGGSMRPM